MGRKDAGRAKKNIKTKTEQLEAVTQAMASFLETGNWQEASSLILRSALSLTDSRYGLMGVVVRGKNGAVLRALAIEGIDWEKKTRSKIYKDVRSSFRNRGYFDLPNKDNSICSVITTGKVVISNDPQKDPRLKGGIQRGYPALRSFLGVPILKGEQLVGMIGLANREGGYALKDLTKIEILCHGTGFLYDRYQRQKNEKAQEGVRKRQEESIHYLAYNDLLTDLPSRISFLDNIERAISKVKGKNISFPLFILDIDRLRELNDTLGHDNGDMILQQIGLRLREVVEETGKIARLGGDEFAILLPNRDPESALDFVQKMIRKFEEPFSIGGLSLNLAISVGLAFFPDHGDDTHTLIRRAEIAMYAAKKSETRWAVYTPQYDLYSPTRLVLASELRQAIESDRLFLVYQPKIDLKTGQTIGAEALVRWKHPKLGFIPPDQFITLAEQTGMIGQLTLWVLREVLRQTRLWHLEGLEISVAMNLSVRSLQTPQLLGQIEGLLSTQGIAPCRLRLEITEGLIMVDPTRAMEIITSLTGKGIRVSIDNFGTGYSSIDYLKRLPVDEIKIDKSFVINMMADVHNPVIVHSVIELAHNLGLKAIAEGVESEEVLDRLTSLGCDAAQGYFISRPIPVPEFKSFLRTAPIHGNS